MPEWLSPTPREEMLARVVRRGRRIRLVRRVVAGAAVAGGVAAGAVGYAAGASDSIELGSGRTLPDATAGYHACPGSGPIGDLRRGDRVLLTGVSEDGAWYEIRSPFQLLDRVWIPASVVTPDEDTELPEADCELTEDELVLATGEVLETTTTLPEEETTTTTEPEETTTTVPGQVTLPTQPPVTQQPVSPTTAPPVTQPPDTTPPTITSLARDHHAIREPTGEFCDAPSTSTEVRAHVSDTSGLQSVRLHWSFDNGAGTEISGSKAMTLESGTTKSGTWRAVLGPFPNGTLSGSNIENTNWSVRALDKAGNSHEVHSNVNSAVELQGC